MPLGMEVGLGPGHTVLDGNPAPPAERGKVAPWLFGPCLLWPSLLWPNGWIDQDATWYKSRPRPRRHCVRQEPSSPAHEKGDSSPHFLAHVCCRQTVAHLSNSWALVAKLTAGYRRVCPGISFPLKIAPFHGDLDPQLIHGSLSQPQPTTQTASRSV